MPIPGFQDSFLVAGIMCHGSCGQSIQQALMDCLEQCKNSHVLPADAHLIIDAEPQTLGLHRLFLTIESEEDLSNLDKQTLAILFKKAVEDTGFEVIEKLEKNNAKVNLDNWLNIAINLISMGLIFALSLVCTPSLLLTASFIGISFSATLFTARHYIRDFFTQLRRQQFTTMPTTITLGWVLSMAHMLYHSLAMPLAMSFSMTFMSFIMPLALILIINSMDELKRLLLTKSKQMQLQGMSRLFPQMAQEYECYSLSADKQAALSQLLSDVENLASSSEHIKSATLKSIQELLTLEVPVTQEKNALKMGMILTIPQGTCFPVDCILLEENARVDASLLTGEPQQIKQRFDAIPAGAVNLSQSVKVFTTQDSYNSTINKLLFRSNRAQEIKKIPANVTFHYFYLAFVVVSIIASIFIPISLGLYTTALLLQNIIGILFAVCPCTIAIAHELPVLLSMHQRNKKGITLRNERLIKTEDTFHTVVFDKTGTLTTGNSEVESSEGISSALWQRIYLLEHHFGAEHPLAKAITRHVEEQSNGQFMFNEISDPSIDPQNKGLSATVQGRKIHIGNASYLQHCHISLPPLEPRKLEQGLSPVYVAEDNIYTGVIYIKHEVRNTTLAALTRLKKEGKRIIMLTGDNQQVAQGFNLQNDSLFENEDIHAQQTPQNKENFLSTLMDNSPKGVWFVGDGLNDAPCARVVSEKEGVSCAMTADDKAAFFTDMNLNGSLNYLFEHAAINTFVNKIIFQNQLLLTYSLAAFLTFIVSFSIAGITVSPFIPLYIMVSTTLFTLFNSYRVPLAIDNALDEKKSWLKQFLASDWSIVLLAGSSFLFTLGMLLSTVSAGELTFPGLIFTTTLSAASSLMLLVASSMLGFFIIISVVYLSIEDETVPLQEEPRTVAPTPTPLLAARLTREEPLFSTSQAQFNGEEKEMIQESAELRI